MRQWLNKLCIAELMTFFRPSSGRLSWVGARALGNSAGAKNFPAARWKWSGCSHNVLFGGDFAKAFLDGRRQATDIQARVNQHNNRAGRLVGARNSLNTNFSRTLINVSELFCSDTLLATFLCIPRISSN